MVRLVDLLAALSRLADLGFGLQVGQSLRSAALAAVLGRSLGLADDDVRAGMYSALLHHVGCVGYAHETVGLFGDEFAAQVAGERTNLADPREAVTTLMPALMRGRAPLDRARVALILLTGRGKRFGQAYDTASCEVGRDAARRLGLPQAVQHSVYHSFEWWNGGGVPAGLAGEAILPGARLARVCAMAGLFDAVGGVDLAVDAVQRRRGGILDPHIVGHFAGRAQALLAEVNAADPPQLVAALEPQPAAMVAESGLVDVSTVFGDLADLKTPWTHGHARGVAELAHTAGTRLGLASADRSALELAALLHDVGRVAVSTAVWEKPGQLNTHEWEQVRLHAYHSERIVAASQRLAPLASLVGMHHERCDGSGYHRGCGRGDLSMPARVLAAADAYQAMTHPRPHRPALAPQQVEHHLRDEATTGRFDPDAVGAVLASAGHDTPVVRRQHPAGLTDREVQVLRLLAEGCSNKQIAQRLVISRRTAEYHVQQMYTKIGTSSRAAAAMFAMEHRLLEGKDR